MNINPNFLPKSLLNDTDTHYLCNSFLLVIGRLNPWNNPVEDYSNKSQYYWKIVNENYPNLDLHDSFTSWESFRENFPEFINNLYTKRYSHKLRNESEYYDDLDTPYHSNYLKRYSKHLDDICSYIRNGLYTTNDSPIFKKQAQNILISPIKTTLIHLFLYQRNLYTPEFWTDFLYRNDLFELERYPIDVQPYINESFTHLKISLLHGIYIGIESIFRKIYRYTKNKNPKSYYVVYNEILNYGDFSELSKVVDIFSIANKTRNTFHNNGMFSNTLKEYEYRGIKIIFEEARYLRFTTMAFILDIITDLINITIDVLNSVKLSTMDDLELINLPGNYE